MHSDNWYILGAGSIGCLWAASLCHKGEHPYLILRENRYQQLKENHQLMKNHVSLKLSAAELSVQYDVDVVSPATVNVPISRLIVCTKAQSSLEAINSVKPHLTENCQILLLQNGMGSQQAINEAFPTQTVWAGSSTDGAYLAAPFEVCHAGQGQTWIGPMKNDETSVDSFNDLLNNFRLKVTPCDNIEQKLWEKLAINCCINGLTALFNCRNGELLDNSEKQSWLDQLIDETSTVLAALQIQIPSLKERVYGVCQTTANNISSTCQDARLGRTTELSFINGFLIDQAKGLGIPVKSHKQLMDKLRTSGIH